MPGKKENLMPLTTSNKIPFGGDYNPDQWPVETLELDIAAMKELHVNTVTLPVFSWAKLQPAENIYDFSWLDVILDKLSAAGINCILATPSAAQPAWMSRKYPEILPVDRTGVRRTHGGRTSFCPNNSDYRRLSAAIAKKMAGRYADKSSVLLWHVNNEYGTYCWCENCRRRFIEWLQRKYVSLERLNSCWYTAFWGQTVYDWNEIAVPDERNLVVRGNGHPDKCYLQSVVIDYHRFMSQSIYECYAGERDAIKSVIPDALVTTNIWGLNPRLDLFAWAKGFDIASWDNYPSMSDHPANPSLQHDIIRSLKKGEPFILMEQTPNQQNWQDYNALKRPGVMRLHSYQALAHGADALLFFQFRQSRGGCEKFHSALVPHSGSVSTRIGNELKKLGAELEALGDTVAGGRFQTKAALLVDWQSWWGCDYSSGPSVELEYLKILRQYYQAVFEIHIAVDIVSVDDDFSGYSLLVAPALYMISASNAAKIADFVKQGGHFVTTLMSGIVDENDQVYGGGTPGAFRELLGISYDESDALFPHMRNRIRDRKSGDCFECSILCDLVNPHTAEVIAEYDSDFYTGHAALTDNTYGAGSAMYIGTLPDIEYLKRILLEKAASAQIVPLVRAPGCLEATVRNNKNGSFLFLLNHGEEEVQVCFDAVSATDVLNGISCDASVKVEAKGVRILRID